MSFSRYSPRSFREMPGRSSSSSRRLAVVCETRTCPPCPTAEIRAARWTAMPTYRSPARAASPVWMPIRTRTLARRPAMGAAIERSLAFRRGEHGVAGAREGDEERVALVVDLLPAVMPRTPRAGGGGGRRASPRTRPAERLSSGRALDVREQEGRGSRTHPMHGGIIPDRSTSCHADGPGRRSPQALPVEWDATAHAAPAVRHDSLSVAGPRTLEGRHNTSSPSPDCGTPGCLSSRGLSAPIPARSCLESSAPADHGCLLVPDAGGAPPAFRLLAADHRQVADDPVVAVITVATLRFTGQRPGPLPLHGARAPAAPAAGPAGPGTPRSAA